MDDQAYSMLPYFYENIFPLERIFRWLKIDEKREISFTLQNGMYLRYLNFKSKEELQTKILSIVPVKIDFGAVYANRQRKGTECIPVIKELVFNIDLTD
ncbi:primase, DNA, polypeptide 1 (49kDa) [Hamiltosporidium tvaerminnensis]|nr:primase, DNA, polypeptide 1 (49kDa) [Hamiltosporidium tvaerminnensis]